MSAQDILTFWTGVANPMVVLVVVLLVESCEHPFVPSFQASDHPSSLQLPIEFVSAVSFAPSFQLPREFVSQSLSVQEIASMLFCIETV
jgi:hypothetical protein